MISQVGLYIFYVQVSIYFICICGRWRAHPQAIHVAIIRGKGWGMCIFKRESVGYSIESGSAGITECACIGGNRYGPHRLMLVKGGRERAKGCQVASGPMQFCFVRLCVCVSESCHKKSVSTVLYRY